MEKIEKGYKNIDKTQSTSNFIETVKRYEAIYDTTNPDYKNMENKSLAWQAVAMEANLTVDACKRKWKNLRDSYTKFLRSFRVGSNNSRKYQYWAHAQHMDFLRPFQGPIRSNRKSNEHSENESFNTTNKDEELTCDLSAVIFEKITPHQNILNTTQNSSFNELPMEQLPMEQLPMEELPMEEQPIEYNFNQQMELKPEPIPTLKFNFSSSLKQHKKLKRNSSSKFPLKAMDMDSTSLFFLSLAKSVRKMPRKYQIAVKMDCIRIVNNAELELENFITESRNVIPKQYIKENRQMEYNPTLQQQGDNSEHFVYVMSPSKVETMIDISSEDDTVNV